jgi:hypothetical protein
MLVMRTSMITVARFPEMPCQGYFLGASNPGSVVVDHIKSVSNSGPIPRVFRAPGPDSNGPGRQGVEPNTMRWS